jgi:hypothetical protein
VAKQYVLTVCKWWRWADETRTFLLSPPPFFVMEGVYIQQGAREPQSTTPEGRGGGGAPPPIIEVVGADHGVLAVQVVEGVARKRTRCGSCCRAACN